MSDIMNEKVIYHKWGKLGFDKSIRNFFGEDASLEKKKTRCLKYSLGPPHNKSGVWKLKVKIDKRTFPVILKIIQRKRWGNEIEINFYRKLGKTLQDVIPQIYHLQSDGDFVWVLTEYCKPISDQMEFHPKYFLKIMPGLAKLHARTFNTWKGDLYEDWLPFYHSESLKRQRKQMMDRTLRYVDKGMGQTEKKADLKSVLKPYYRLLQKIYKKGPVFFPQVIEAGMCITHNDLQLRNIGCNDLMEQQWDVKILDWESAKYFPCWFDVVSLIGVFFGYRQDFKREEDQITEQCVRLYADEMQKHGVKFGKDPFKLYKMAYLQRVLEYDLYHHITKGLDRKEITLLPIFLDKIKVWGKELGLH